MALDAGCDLNCGCTYAYVTAALDAGLITEEQITESCIRLYTTRFLLGLFGGSEYDQIPYEVTECKEHRQLAVDAARKATVLLKNDGILPLDKKKIRKIAVVGPNADSRTVLMGNYHGTSSRCTTILQGIQKEAGDEIRVFYSEGCHLYKNKVEPLAWEDDRIPEAVIAARQSDVAIVVLGLDETIEGEEPDESNEGQAGDKETLRLPHCQQRLLSAVIETGKPVITILMSGSAIDLRYADEHTNAVLQAWYPGAEGGTAVSDILFGRCSPGGKLPVTFYHDTEGLPEFTDYSMKNRTYRYIENEPLYPFGFGLTYGNAAVTEAHLTGAFGQQKNLSVSYTIENTGTTDVEEVVQVYIKDRGSRYAVKNHSLCAFQRIMVRAGEKRVMNLEIDKKAMTIVDDEGRRYVDSNEFSLYVGTSQPDRRSIELMKKSPIEIPIHLSGDRI